MQWCSVGFVVSRGRLPHNIGSTGRKNDEKFKSPTGRMQDGQCLTSLHVTQTNAEE